MGSLSCWHLEPKITSGHWIAHSPLEKLCAASQSTCHLRINEMDLSEPEPTIGATTASVTRLPPLRGRPMRLHTSTKLPTCVALAGGAGSFPCREQVKRGTCDRMATEGVAWYSHFFRKFGPFVTNAARDCLHEVYCAQPSHGDCPSDLHEMETGEDFRLLRSPAVLSTAPRRLLSVARN